MGISRDVYTENAVSGIELLGECMYSYLQRSELLMVRRTSSLLPTHWALASTSTSLNPYYLVSSVHLVSEDVTLSCDGARSH